MAGGQGFEDFMKQQFAPQGGAGFGAGRFMQGAPGQQGFPGQQGAFPGQTPTPGFPGQPSFGAGLMPWDFQVPTPAMPTPPPLFQSPGPFSAPAPAGPATRRRREPPHDPGR